MKTPFYSLLLALLLAASSTIFAADSPKEGKTPTEFKEAKVAEAIETLAKLANLRIAMSDQVRSRGTFTMTQLDRLSPREALAVVVAANRLSMAEIGGVYYILTAEERSKTFHSLDNEFLPVAIAKLKKRYFDALMAEGFSRAEALQIVAAHQIPSLELNVSEP